MAEDKSSFILYADLLPTVEKLSDKRAGVLFKTILRYVNDKNPQVTDILVDLVFEPLKQKLKRDLKKWEAERSKKSEAGKLGGIKSGETRRSRSKRSSASKHEANEAVSVTVNGSVNDTVRKKYIKPDENFKLELPEQKINSAIQYLTITKNINATPEIVLSLWAVFKEKHFTGENPYPSESKIFSHFLETLKFEPNNNHNGRNNNSKGTGKDKVNTTGHSGL